MLQLFDPEPILSKLICLKFLVALAQMKQMEQENEQDRIGLKAGVPGVPGKFNDQR